MSEKKGTSTQGTNVKVGNISDVSGNINIAGGDITTNQTTTLNTMEIKQLFEHLYTTIESRPETPPADKEDLKVEVEKIQSMVMEAVQKSQKLEEGFLSRRLRNIARMAPDVLDVMVATLGSPLAGLGVAVKKIAEKAKEETSAG